MNPRPTSARKQRITCCLPITLTHAFPPLPLRPPPQADEHQAAVRAASRRLPAMAEQRRAADAASRRTPKVERPYLPRAAKRQQAVHQVFQPRRFN